MKTTLSVSTIRQYFTNDCRKTIRWMSKHPLKACGFTFLFTLLPALMGVVSAAEEQHAFGFLLGVHAFLLGVLYFVMWKDARRKLLATILVFSLIFQGVSLNAEEPEQPPEPVGWVAGAIVVVVFGGIVYYQLRGFCQRRFPRPPARDTNAAPYALIRPASANDCAATWVFVGYVSDECIEPSGGENDPLMMMELSGSVERTESGIQWRLSQARLDHTQDLVDAAEFERLLLVEHGVKIGKISGEQHYAMNGTGCAAWESPIVFSMGDAGRPTISVGNGDLFDGVMERSTDLLNWQEIGRMRCGEGQQIRMTDTSQGGQMFYRFRPL